MKTVRWMIIFALILMGPAVWAGNGKDQDAIASETSQEEVIAWNAEEGDTDVDLVEPGFDEEEETSWGAEEGSTDADLEEPESDEEDVGEIDPEE